MKTLKYKVERLRLTTKDVLELESNYLAIPTNWELNLYNALSSVSDLLQKYEKLVLVVSAGMFYPPEYVQGFLRYCHSCQISYAVIESVAAECPAPGTAYFTLSDKDLASLIKVGTKLGYRVGEELGLLSLGDSPIKKLMGLTVITTGLATDDQYLPLFYPHPKSRTNVPNAEVIRRISL